MEQQNSKTHVRHLLHKARTRHNCFPFGLIISQVHNSFECLFEAYSELWRKRMQEEKITTGKNSWPKNCQHQLLPCYLEVMKEVFLNGSMSWFVLVSNFLTTQHMLLHTLHLSIHHYIAVMPLCKVAVCCSIFHGGNEVVFPNQWYLDTGSCFKYILDSIFFFHAE